MKGLLKHWLTWFIQKRGFIQYRNTTVLLWDTKYFCCGFDRNFFCKLEQKQSILYYKLRTLCLLNSQWRTFTLTTCLHADVCRQNGPARRVSLWDEVYSIWAAPRRPIGAWHQSTARAIRKHAEPSALCSSRGAAQIEPRKGLWSNTLMVFTLVYELPISLSISPRSHPPPPKKTLRI